MKWLIGCEQNSIKMCSKNFDQKLTLMAIGTDLLSKGLPPYLSNYLSLSPKLGTKILHWCSYGVTLKKKENQLSHCFCHFCTLPQNLVV